MNLKIASSTVDIAPQVECVRGCCPDVKPSVETSGSLEANIIMLSNGTSRALVVSLDALYVGGVLRSHLEEALKDVIHGEELFLAASHTHYAPMLDFSKPRMGAVHPIHFESIAARIAEQVRNLLAMHGQLVEVRIFPYESAAAVGRRRMRWMGARMGRVCLRCVVLAPARGPRISRASTLVEFCGKDGPVAYIWNFACHPTSLPDGPHHSAHFVDEVRKFLRARAGTTVPVVFLQGFSGDLRPPSVARPKSVFGWLRLITLGRWFEPFSEEEYRRWLDGLVSEMDGALTQEPATTEREVELQIRRVTTPASTMVRGLSLDRTMTYHRISIGRLDLLGVSAEPVFEFQRMLAGRSPNRHTICVGCIDDVICYVPTAGMQRLGGYEVDGFCESFGVEALQSDVQTRFLEGLEQCKSDGA